MKEMKTFREYQRWTKETALYENPVMYPCLELGGEVGEVVAVTITNNTVLLSRGSTDAALRDGNCVTF